jgi:hypothetical protein
MRRARWIAAVAGVLMIATGVPRALATPSTPPPTTPTLPAPFSTWNVVINPSSDPHVEWVDFNSAVLHQRVTIRVILPDAYFTTTAPLPVMYYLHGTIRIGTDPAIDNLVDQLDAAGAGIGYPFGPGSAHDEASWLADEVSKMQFLVVSLDAEANNPWCEHCAYVNGVNGQGVNAEDHLYDEVIPLVRAMYRVRTDRDGRGIMGASMGAGGAMIQETRHPDMFSVTAALSPPIDYVHDKPYGDPLLWATYLREQGYPSPELDPIVTEATNAADLLNNLIGENDDTIVTVGEGCILEAGVGECQQQSAVDQPVDAVQEVFIRHNDDTVIPAAIARGVPISYITYAGVHFVVNHDIFDEYMLDRINRDFASNPATPPSFSYKSGDPQFSIWGYNVSIVRPNQEFVTLDAKTNGTGLTISGTGTATITTPPTFTPDSVHTVAIAPSDTLDRPAEQLTVTADSAGRLSFAMNLGATHPVDQNDLLTALGLWTSPQTTVTVLN